MGFPQWSLFPVWLFILWRALREFQYKKQNGLAEWIPYREQILNSTPVSKTAGNIRTAKVNSCESQKRFPQFTQRGRVCTFVSSETNRRFLIKFGIAVSLLSVIIQRLSLYSIRYEVCILCSSGSWQRIIVKSTNSLPWNFRKYFGVSPLDYMVP